MVKRILCGHGAKPFFGKRAERPAGSREPKPLYLAVCAAAKALENRGLLAVHRHNLSTVPKRLIHELMRADDAFLVRKRHGFLCAKRCKKRFRAYEAGYPVHNRVNLRQRSCDGRGLRANFQMRPFRKIRPERICRSLIRNADKCGAKRKRLCKQQFRVSICAKRANLPKLRMRVQHLQRLPANGACAAKHRNGFHTQVYYTPIILNTA